MKQLAYHIHRIINEIYASNTFIISRESACIVVDPGSETLIDYLQKNKFFISYIILTHEHFDHCLGVNSLRKNYPDAKLVASEYCNKNIQNAKMNLSRYNDENGKGFIIAPADIIIDCDTEINLLGLRFRFVLTPGHSQGSMCFSFNYKLFSGDVIIPKCKPIFKLKGGSIDEYKQSMKKLKQIYSISRLSLYPGHGEIYENYSL